MTKEEFEKATNWIVEHKKMAYTIDAEWLDMPNTTEYVHASSLLAMLEDLTK